MLGGEKGKKSEKESNLIFYNKQNFDQLMCSNTTGQLMIKFKKTA